MRGVVIAPSSVLGSLLETSIALRIRRSVCSCLPTKDVTRCNYYAIVRTGFVSSYLLTFRSTKCTGNFESRRRRMLLRPPNPSRHHSHYCSQEQGISEARACCGRDAPCMMEGRCKARRSAADPQDDSTQPDQQATLPVQAKCPSIFRTASILHKSSCVCPACIP